MEDINRVSDLKIIGKGRTAEIFELNNEKVVKLFFSGFSSCAIKREVKIGMVLNEQKVPAPFLYETRTINDREGIVYERINGETLLEFILKNPLKTNSIGKDMAAIHFDIHSHNSNDLIRQKKNFKNAIEDSENILGDRTNKILQLLNILQERDAICHGDFHPGNIMVYDQGCIAIDWMNAYSGNPLSDVVRTQLMISGPDIPDEISIMVKFAARIIKKSLCNAYTKKYCKLAGIDKSELNRWIPVIAASRLRENIPGEKEWLLSLIDLNLDT